MSVSQQFEKLYASVKNGNEKALARLITLVENGRDGYERFMESLPPSPVKIIGITGPPGAGKSTLADALVTLLVQQNKRVGVICVDPSSPFSRGAVLGDRIRMNRWYNHPKVFIRSLASRGAMGGLNPRILEITDLMKASGFDYILLETVGVGQSEVEIAGLADTTVVVLVPGAGDEIQMMKSGLMEIADLFVINKADKPGAAQLEQQLRTMLDTRNVPANDIPVIQTIASEQKGIGELLDTIIEFENHERSITKKWMFLAEKAYYLIQQKKMREVNKIDLLKKISQSASGEDFNLYRFVNKFVD